MSDSWVYPAYRWHRHLPRGSVSKIDDWKELGEGAWRHVRRALAAVLPALLLLLASLVASLDWRTKPLPPKPPVRPPTPERVVSGPRLGPFFVNVYQGGAVETVPEELLEDLHLTETDIERIRDDIEDGPSERSRDVHLTEEDIERIERAVDRELIKFGDTFLTRPPGPVTRASTGPAVQFGPLAGARRGFIYDLEVDEDPLPIREIGLELQLRSNCDEEESRTPGDERPRLRLIVRRFPDGRVFDEDCRTVRFQRPRNDPWDESDRDAAAHFEVSRPPGSGFWYAIVVSSEDAVSDEEARHYVIVRRCATRCWEEPSQETSEAGG